MSIFWYDTDKNVYKTHLDALKSGKQCYIYYNDALYGSVNWKTEPSFSLKELYKLRAQEIRDTYQKVVVCLSGGIDSRNVLESFYYNNIHIDEIISVGAFSQDSYFGSDENNNREIYVNVKQLLNEMNLPKTKISFLDYTEHFRNPKSFSLISEYDDYWIYNISCWKSPHHLYWNDLGKHIIKDNKKTCWVTGTGKTHVSFFEKKTYVSFSELELMNYSGKYIDGNLHRENFYWGNSLISTEIMKKQAYTMVKTFSKFKDPWIFSKNYDKIYNKVVYDLRNPLIIKTKKSSSVLLSIRDTFIRNKTDSEIYKYYKSGLIKLMKDVPDIQKTHTTRKYYLKEFL
jgi:hypothetical protein